MVFHYFTPITLWCIINHSQLVFWMFIYFWEKERERKSVHLGGRGRERGRQRFPSRRHTVSAEPDKGVSPTKHEIMTWDEIKSQRLNLTERPGTRHFWPPKHFLPWLSFSIKSKMFQDEPQVYYPSSTSTPKQPFLLLLLLMVPFVHVT